MRESPSIFAFPLILAIHTVGLALLVGINAVIALRLHGVAPRIPVSELWRLVPVMWTGLALNAVSGLALLAAYPTKALTNPVFHLKLGCIAAALWLFRRMRLGTSDDGTTATGSGRPVTLLAVGSLVCWAVGITAGRFLAYTYIRLMAHSIPRPWPWMP